MTEQEQDTLIAILEWAVDKNLHNKYDSVKEVYEEYWNERLNNTLDNNESMCYESSEPMIDLESQYGEQPNV